MQRPSKRIKLSILDFGLPPAWGDSSRSILLNSSRMAELADRLGYSRYWVSEHYARYGAWGSPTPLVGHLASRTQYISVGPAGVLASFCDPVRLAGDFRLLECLYPGRIDLGIARGIPAQPALAAHVAAKDAPERYDQNTDAIVRFMRSSQEREGSETEAPTPLPADVNSPMLWMHGSGTRSRDAALRLRTAFCYSLFHNAGAERTPEVLREYLDCFVPDAQCNEPRAALAVCVVCAETQSEARAIAVANRSWADDRKIALNVLGDARSCAEQLHGLAHDYDVNELVLLDLCRDAAERERCFTLLASTIFD